MSYAAILVHVQNEDAAQSRLKCARALAVRFAASSIGVEAPLIGAISSRDGMADSAWFTAMRDLVEINLKGAAPRFKPADAEVPKGTVREPGLEFPGQTLALSSRAAETLSAQLHTPLTGTQ